MRDVEKPTPEMIARFRERTQGHIELVRVNLLVLDGWLGHSRHALAARGEAHDHSKFTDEESLGYVWLTWLYDRREENSRFRCPREVSAKIDRALLLHRSRNSHHPEAHPCPDAMDDLDVIEMVCDWTAIAQETGAMSARVWAEANAFYRWGFSLEKRELIFKTIAELDSRNRTTGSLRICARPCA